MRLDASDSPGVKILYLLHQQTYITTSYTFVGQQMLPLLVKYGQFLPDVPDELGILRQLATAHQGIVKLYILDELNINIVPLYYKIEPMPSRLKHFCQLCRKQCKDENGFKCHVNSSSHQEKVREYASNPLEHIQRASKQFQGRFVQMLKTKYPGQPKYLQ